MANPLKEIIKDLITANHILHHHKVVDAFGHISVRHPTNPDFYILSGSVAPALVESSDDLIEYRVEDSSPVNPDAKKGYLERFIHGEIYKRFKDVNSVVHSHSEAVVPYTISDARLVPVYHMAGFLGSEVPIFDITKLYSSSHDPAKPKNMLVSTAEYGSALADMFGPISPATPSMPKNSVVLMAKHGFTAVGSSIQAGVFRAIYAQKNAEIQTTTMLLNGAMAEVVGRGVAGQALGLEEEEARDCGVFGEGVVGRPWVLWVREVKASGLYVNRMTQMSLAEIV